MIFDTPEYTSTVGLAQKKTDERPEPLFWFQRKNGEKFCMPEKEASIGYFHKKDRPNYDYIGYTDGTIYYGGLAEFQKVFKEQGQIKAQEFLRELYQKEAQGAEPRVLPRNFLYTNQFGQPVNQNGDLIPFNPQGYARQAIHESPAKDSEESQPQIPQQTV